MNEEEIRELVERLCSLGRTGSVLRLLAWLTEQGPSGLRSALALQTHWWPLLSGLPPRSTLSLIQITEALRDRTGLGDLSALISDLKDPREVGWYEERLLRSEAGAPVRTIGGLVWDFRSEQERLSGIVDSRLTGDQLGIAAGLDGRLQPPGSWHAGDQQELVRSLLGQLDASAVVYPDTEQGLRGYWGHSLGLAYCVTALDLAGLCRSQPDVVYIGGLGPASTGLDDLSVFKQGGEFLKIRAAFEDGGARVVVLGAPEPGPDYVEQILERVQTLRDLRAEGLTLRFTSLDDRVEETELIERYREVGVETSGQCGSLQRMEKIDLVVVEVARMRQLGQLRELLFKNGEWHVESSLKAPRPAPLGPLLDSLNARTDESSSPAQQARLLHACDTALRVLLLAHIRRSRESLTEEEILALFLTRPGQVPRGQEWRGRLEWIGDLLETRIKATDDGRTGQYRALGEQLRRAREILQAGAVDGRTAVDHLQGLLRRLLRLFPGEGSLDGTSWSLEEQAVDLSPLLTFDAPGQLLYWEGPAGSGSSGHQFWHYDPRAGVSVRRAIAAADLQEHFGEGIAALERRLCQSHPQRDTLARHDQFVGRRWLFERLEQRRADAGDAGTVTLLVATAGWGKSAVCAELLRSQGHELSFFFRNGRQSAFDLAKDLEAALSRRLGVGSQTPTDCFQSHERLSRLLGQLSEGLAATGQREWIVVDGLDEAEEPDACTGWLPSLQNLPAHIDFLFTARIDQEPRAAFTKAERLDVTEDPRQAQEDVREYVKARLGELFGLGRLDIDLVVSEVSEVFLLAKLLCDDVICGKSSPEDMVEALRSGRITNLNSYYEEWWGRLIPAEQPLVLRLLALLCVAEESLSDDLIDEVLDLSYADRLTTFSQVRALLSEQDGRLGFLHKTLPDFLQREIKGFPRNCKQEEKKLCDHLIHSEEDPRRRSDYATRHLATHLANRGRAEELWGLAGDPRYLVRRIELDGVDALLRHWDELTRQDARPPEFLRGLYRYLGRAAPAFRLAADSLIGELRLEAPRLTSAIEETESDPRVERFMIRIGQMLSSSPLQAMAGDSLGVIQGHEFPVDCVVALADGRVVSGSSDNTLRVWNPDTGECLQVLQGHECSVMCVVALADGRVVSGSRDRTLRLWDVYSGQCLGRAAMRSPVMGIPIANPNHIVACDEAGRFRTFSLRG